MKLTLDNLADKGCWISHDRVNAFVSSTARGVAEIGYHGTQPVSKNSRILVGAGTAVMSFLVRMPDGVEHIVSFAEVDWTPSQIRLSDDTCDLEVSAFERAIRCMIRPSQPAEVRLIVNLDTRNRDTHGTRKWSEPEVDESSIVISCRDRIVLNEWLKRSGPYAGDFLIPEPMRRVIFDRPVRSGEASLEDLRPEFRDAEIPLYDASVFIRIGGNDVQVEQQDNRLIFAANAHHGHPAQFFIQFADGRSSLDALPIRYSSEPVRAPAMSVTIPGYPAVERFVPTVPGLVDSAIVKDLGMPRATPAAYYWIWAWDSFVTGSEMLRWGDYATTRRMAQFVNAHRDESGLIPARWTRSLQPMDTPPRGSLDFLFATFVYQHAVESDDLQVLVESYPYLLDHLEELEQVSDSTGMFAASGFYPDFTAKFGRTGSSAVAMEVAAHFTFARIMENIARLMSDGDTERVAVETADRIETHFLDRFWDGEAQFPMDAFDMKTGRLNKSYPLFTFLFLQSTLGIPLIQSRMDALASFCAENLLGPSGTSLLPAWDPNRMNEDATASWYPHWDVYLMKILRRGGRSAEIMEWLGKAECVLTHLGYCPEFIKLDGVDLDDPAGWLNHGAVSNLNCVTGWFRAIIEGLFGIEVDPGGLTVVPLSLPIESLSMDGLVYRGSRWNVRVRNAGGRLEALVVDGRRLDGICKIPVSYYDGKDHSLEILYGTDGPDLHFREIINGEVLDVECSDRSATVTVRPLGTCDVRFVSSDRPTFSINEDAADFEYEHGSGIGRARVRMKEEAILKLALPS